ncbi:MAG: hypothetical protein J4G03_03590 [Gemmatimonadetes bacterium]|nr:hypothetical protein [Gemmatimonadota bacterium]
MKTVLESSGVARLLGVVAGSAALVGTVAVCGGDPVEPPPTNSAPTASSDIPTQMFTLPGDDGMFDVASFFTDPDGDALTYTATSGEPSMLDASVSGSVVTLSLVSGVELAETLTTTVDVTARDPDGLAASASVPVEITPGNKSPVAAIDTLFVELGLDETVEEDLDLVFSDPDGDDLTFTASSSDDNIVSVSISGSIFSMTGEAEGEATITIRATDPGGLYVEATVGVTVTRDNRWPTTVGTMDDYELEIGDSVTVDVSSYFSDPDGDDLTFTVSSDNEEVATAEMSGSILTIAAIASGQAQLTVTATDPDGRFANQWPEVTVPAEPEQVFFEDFEDGFPEDWDWNASGGSGNGAVEVVDGILRITPPGATDDNPTFAWANPPNFDPPLDDWEIRASVGRENDAIYSQIFMEVEGSATIDVYIVGIGDGWNNTDTTQNYVLAACGNGCTLVASGESDAVKDGDGEMNDVVISKQEGRWILTVNGDTLVNTSDAGHPDQVPYVDFTAVNVSGSDNPGALLADYLEIWITEEFDRTASDGQTETVGGDIKAKGALPVPGDRPASTLTREERRARWREMIRGPLKTPDGR